jgi:hypothetical protein
MRFRFLLLPAACLAIGEPAAADMIETVEAPASRRPISR